MQTRDELLIEAARSNNITDVETCIQNGANVNFRDHHSAVCALDVAAEQGHCSVIRILLKAGARVDGVRLSREYNYLTTDNFRIQKSVFMQKQHTIAAL